MSMTFETDAVRSDTVVRYLKGQLTPEEQIELEQYIIEHPAVVDSVELDRLLFTFMSDVDERSKSATRPKALSVRRYGWHALAAGVLIAVTIGLVPNLTPPDGENLHVGGQVSGSVVFIETLRSSSQPIVNITAPSDATHFTVFWQTQPLAPGEYRIEISALASQLPVFSKAVQLHENHGEIVLMLPTKQFNSGNYTLTLNNDRHEVVQTTAFNIHQ